MFDRAVFLNLENLVISSKFIGFIVLVNLYKVKINKNLKQWITCLQNLARRACKCAKLKEAIAHIFSAWRSKKGQRTKSAWKLISLWLNLRVQVFCNRELDFFPVNNFSHTLLIELKLIFGFHRTLPTSRSHHTWSGSKANAFATYGQGFESRPDLVWVPVGLGLKLISGTGKMLLVVL